MKSQVKRVCQAAVFEGVGQPLAVREIAIPVLRGGDMLVEIEACTICGSDLHSIRGRRPCEVPAILGHEVVGRVARVGDAGFRDRGGSNISEGDRITFSLTRSREECGTCRNCRRGFPQKCAKLFKYGHEPWSSANPLSGGFAEYTVIGEGTAVFRVAEPLPWQLVAPLNCAGATAFAALRAAGNIETLLVLGAGMLGCFATAAAASRGIRALVADPLEARQELARRLGAEIATGLETLPAAAREQFPGGFDAVLDMSGQTSSIRLGIELLAVAGRLVLVGSVLPTDPLAISPEQIVRGLLQIIGVHNYHPDDLADAIRFVETQGDRLQPILPGIREFPLTQINQALSAAESGKALRVAVRSRSTRN